MVAKGNVATAKTALAEGKSFVRISTLAIIRFVQQIDFDRWRSDDEDVEEEETARSVMTDYPGMYENLQKEEYGYRKGSYLKSIDRLTNINFVKIFRTNKNGLLGILQSMSVRRLLVRNDGNGNSLLSRRNRFYAWHVRGRWKCVQILSIVAIYGSNASTVWLVLIPHIVNSV